VNFDTHVYEALYGKIDRDETFLKRTFERSNRSDLSYYRIPIIGFLYNVILAKRG
jgi:hypothetical protein